MLRGTKKVCFRAGPDRRRGALAAQGPGDVGVGGEDHGSFEKFGREGKEEVGQGWHGVGSKEILFVFQSDLCFESGGVRVGCQGLGPLLPFPNPGHFPQAPPWLTPSSPTLLSLEPLFFNFAPNLLPQAVPGEHSGASALEGLTSED